MKASLYIWRHNPPNLPTWFQHKAIAEVSWEQIKELYELGINVKLINTSDISEIDIILYVDTGLFTR